MPYDQETGIPIHPALSLEKAKLWQAPGDWVSPEQAWLPCTKPYMLEPVILEKTKRNENQLFSTLGGYALYRSDRKNPSASKQYIYKSICAISKIKFCVDHEGKWMVVKTITHEQNSVLNEFSKREAFFLARLGRLKAFYVREIPDGFTKHYLVMDWIDGVSLVTYLPTLIKLNFLLRLQEARAILKAVIDLNSLGILHRDVHEGNLLRQDNGQYQFIDFENSRLEDPETSNELDDIQAKIINDFFSEGELEIIQEANEETKDKMGYEGMLSTAQKRKVYLASFDQLIEERSAKKLKY